MSIDPILRGTLIDVTDWQFKKAFLAIDLDWPGIVIAARLGNSLKSYCWTAVTELAKTKVFKNEQPVNV